MTNKGSSIYKMKSLSDFRVVIFFLTLMLLYCNGEKTHTIAYATCNNTVTMETDQCKRCLTVIDDPPSENELFAYMDLNHIVMEKSKSGKDGGVNWVYDENVVLSPDDITVSLHMWNPGKNLMGQAVPGCCGIPLTSRGCRAKSCFDAPVYMSVTSGSMMVVGAESLKNLKSCTKKRSLARYFNICVHHPTEWATLYNCECIVYDSQEGTLLPGNHSTEVETKRKNLGVWYSVGAAEELIEVCQFEMTKAQVLERGLLINDSTMMDSTLFNRSVYQMQDFNWTNGAVIDTLRDRQFNCTPRLFSGTEMFNLSSATADNDTFTCLMPWPNGTSHFQPYSRHVKCMPHNSRSPKPESQLYTMRIKPSSVVSAMVVIIPICGVVALLLLVCLLGYHWRKKVKKFMKDTKSVPDELDSAMRDNHTSYFMWEGSFQQEEEQEKCQAFDNEERERVSCRKQIQEEDRTHRYLLKLTDASPVLDDLGSSTIKAACLPADKAKNFHDDSGLPGDSTPSFKSGVNQKECECKSNESQHALFASNGTSGALCQDEGKFIADNDSGLSKGSQLSFPCNHHSCNHCDWSSHHTCCHDDVFMSCCHEMKDIIDFTATQGMYWSKTLTTENADTNRHSQASDESGCETGSDPEDCVTEDIPGSGKHPFLKTTSKDSGVVRDYLHVLEGSDNGCAVPGYLPKRFYSNQNIIECV